jgi:hypothetical protein
MATLRNRCAIHPGGAPFSRRGALKFSANVCKIGLKTIPSTKGHTMEQDPSVILRHALSLPPAMRAALAGSLIDSLEDVPDETA